MYRVYNMTFQPIQILYNKETMILPKRKRNSYVLVEELNEQIKKLEKEQLVKIKKDS